MPSNAPGASAVLPADVIPEDSHPADDLERILVAGRAASTALAASTSVRRDAALDAVAVALVDASDRI
ncbi:gamma-glutamyl-phosphate reductase, partial [Clavibacter phaseoli]